MGTVLLYVTTKDKAEARAIGRALVQARLVACVNIFDGMNSLYLWEDQVQDDQEAVLLAKTTEARAPDVVAAIQERHSYECPCIVTLPVIGGNPAFLQWIADTTQVQ